jgi:acyl-[acyl-carrier-protein]-phospholipid O-acyltransferase/long-chain-fatty-acid--[acyl-carrier-protein] ligase
VSQIRQKVTELSCDYFNGLKTPKRSLAGHFVKSARKNWTKRCISDSTGKSLNYGKTLTAAIALAKKIDALASGSENVGICLPPSSGGALANLAVTISGRVAVNMNYTAGRDAIDFATEECGIKCVISSRKFLEKAEISISQDGLVYLEDIASRIDRKEKLIAYLKARFMPLCLLTMGRRRFGDDLATVIFSSGSSGKPKGVMLSHHNIISNIEAIRIVIQIRPDDNLCGILPFFHSFGFNCGLWLPLISGVSVGYVANPLDGEAVGKSIRENRSTIIFAPPTFFLNYIRRVKPEDFASIRLVAAGAEKLKKRLADKFEDKFGIRPLEGYGATELSPVASLSVPDVETDGVYQVGTKPDSVGHPIPGVAIKIVDIETQEELAASREGLIMVKGPNVMVGYLNNEEQTAEVLKDGWYNTGDIGKVDAEGFVTITDRLSRFSKIGGEMVPHIAIEQAYLEGLGTHEQVVAVTSVPDSKKGEILVVLYSDQAGTADKLHEIITGSALPNICKPKRDNYIRVESMPTLGSGKLDVMKLRKFALEAKNGFNT